MLCWKITCGSTPKLSHSMLDQLIILHDTGSHYVLLRFGRSGLCHTLTPENKSHSEISLASANGWFFLPPSFILKRLTACCTLLPHTVCVMLHQFECGKSCLQIEVYKLQEYFLIQQIE